MCVPVLMTGRVVIPDAAVAVNRVGVGALSCERAICWLFVAPAAKKRASLCAVCVCVDG